MTFPRSLGILRSSSVVRSAWVGTSKSSPVLGDSFFTTCFAWGVQVEPLGYTWGGVGRRGGGGWGQALEMAGRPREGGRWLTWLSDSLARGLEPKKVARMRNMDYPGRMMMAKF